MEGRRGDLERCGGLLIGGLRRPVEVAGAERGFERLSLTVGYVSLTLGRVVLGLFDLTLRQ
jgi:hypothetical protein